MSLKLHNTLTRKTEQFTPQNDTAVTLYTCGPTVYNNLHVGNWFGYIMWDILVRTLIANGYTVDRVMNITDVGHLTGENEGDADKGEDKLEKGARREGKSAWEVAELYTQDFFEGMKKLGLIMPEHIAKATDYIPQQLDLVRTLKQKGYTYQINDGIYFDTSKFPTYAEFAGLDLAAQKAGARVEFNPEKRSHSDFALWKFTAPDDTRAMEWETPADLLEPSFTNKHLQPENELTPGPNIILGAQPLESEARREANEDQKIMGFPGWHLECSAMAMTILGDTIDIHTGGIDHIPVHHTNEIAQSEAASGKLFSRFWLHNNHLKSEGTKISKSLGNGYTLQDLNTKGFSPMDFRMFTLQSQYTNEGNFTWENLESAKNRLHHWRNSAALRWQTHDTLQSDGAILENKRTVSLYGASGAILEALNDNLNTPEALRVVDEAFSQLDNKPLANIDQNSLGKLLETIDMLLGLQLRDTTPDIDEDAKRLVLERNRAREAKNWSESDRLRAELESQGIALRDTASGTIWEYLK
ncbi:MAG TPA: cysteine--tRNA ligase [Candidatus Saccharimonadales bacterium]|nr:cysteine--tRNA ligase [Candidatus Saccharimonadales bacterium]